MITYTEACCILFATMVLYALWIAVIFCKLLSQDYDKELDNFYEDSREEER